MKAPTLHSINLSKDDPQAAAINVSHLVSSMVRSYLEVIGSDPKAVGLFMTTLLARIVGMMAGCFGCAETIFLLGEMKAMLEKEAGGSHGRRH